MKITISLNLYGSDFYVVKKTPYVYEDLSEEFDVEVTTLKVKCFDEDKAIVIYDGCKEVEITRDVTSYLKLIRGDEYYELALTLVKE